MRILLHDFAGHPFQAELSRALAARGHEVVHGWFAGDIGPKGRLRHVVGDAETLSFLPLGATISYSKTNLLKRRQGDVAYGRELAAAVRKIAPDVVICGNAPTEVVSPLPAACRAAGAAFVYWVQDFNGIASKKILSRKLPGIGHLVGSYYTWLDGHHLRAADHVVLITEGFLAETDRVRVPRARVSVIPNWGALDEIVQMGRDTPWRHEQGLTRKRIALYSGTLALKHNPQHLRALAQALEARGNTSVVVVAAGKGADDLAQLQRDAPLSALELRPLQPFERFSEVLATADVLLAVLEDDAGSFSVPSKILSYLCAGRPIVLAAPEENLAAEIVRSTGAGSVMASADEAGFVAAALRYLDNPSLADEAGRAGRRYAEENFDIARVADRFETVFTKAIETKGMA